tara:strand:- start:672 stop:848 length:177 start_codon:yes stop_codon:yes gene_type:complete
MPYKRKLPSKERQKFTKALNHVSEKNYTWDEMEKIFNKWEDGRLKYLKNKYLLKKTTH